MSERGKRREWGGGVKGQRKRDMALILYQKEVLK